MADVDMAKRLRTDKQDNKLYVHDFIDFNSLKGNVTNVCQKKIEVGACPGDLFIPTMCSGNIVVEEGKSGHFYWLYGDFHPTPNGIHPRMSKKDVIAKLGRPTDEYNELVQYDLEPVHEDDETDSILEIYFNNDQIALVKLMVLDGICISAY